MAGAPVTLGERFRAIVEHSEFFEKLCGRERFMAMRKHLTWYCRNFRGAAEMRANMVRAHSAEGVRSCLCDYLSVLTAGAETPQSHGRVGLFAALDSPRLTV